MNKWFELLFGTILLIGIIVFAWSSASWGTFWNFRHAAWEFLKGGIFWVIAMVGLLLIVLGINDLKD